MPLPKSVVADENIPREIVTALEQLGYSVYWIAEHESGIADKAVWRLASRRQALLITRDVGFLPQLTKDEILHGPVVLVYQADGIEDSELRATELFRHFITWYVQECGQKDWQYVEVSIKGKHRTRSQCWGVVNYRRKR
ncbi:MAG: DUF5615 family PIN-like protein [Acidobacteria bacterium]|nr:DUF5615 family PIN-like protein [Acidobacteriota bacterium]